MLFEPGQTCRDLEQVQMQIFGRGAKNIRITSDTNHPYTVDWEKDELVFSTVSGHGTWSNSDSVLHEMAHFIIASDEALHLKSWGMSNPWTFWGGQEFQSMVMPGQARTEVKVWAWQHLLSVMSGLNEMDTIRPRPEINLLTDDNTYFPDKGVLSIRYAVNNIIETFPGDDWEAVIRKRFSKLPDILHKEKDRRISGPYEHLSTVECAHDVNIILEQNEKGWFRLSMRHGDGELVSENKTILETRNAERVKAFSEILLKVNAPKHEYDVPSRSGTQPTSFDMH